METANTTSARWRIDDSHPSPLTGPSDLLEAILSSAQSASGTMAINRAEPASGSQSSASLRSPNHLSSGVSPSPCSHSSIDDLGKPSEKQLRKQEEDLFEREQILYRAWERLAQEERRFRLWMQMKGEELDQRERELVAKETILVNQYQQLGQVPPK